MVTFHSSIAQCCCRDKAKYCGVLESLKLRSTDVCMIKRRDIDNIEELGDLNSGLSFIIPKEVLRRLSG